MNLRLAVWCCVLVVYNVRSAAGIVASVHSRDSTNSGVAELEVARNHAKLLFLAISRRNASVGIEVIVDAMKPIISFFNSQGGSESGRPQQIHPFVVLSQQRSGSGMIDTMLNTHPNIVILQGEPYLNGLFMGTLEEAFELEWQRVLKEVKKETFYSSRKSWLGIKVQENQVLNVSGGLGHTDATFIVHWRRNALRQLVSTAVHEQLGPLNPGPHAETPQAKALLASFKPTMRLTSLECDIFRLLRPRSIIHKTLLESSASVCPISHYEDWLAPESKAASTKSILDCLGLPMVEVPLDSVLLPVHADTPLLQTIGNAALVAATLSNTMYSYMLEEGSSAEEIAEALKRSDVFDREPPPTCVPH